MTKLTKQEQAKAAAKSAAPSVFIIRDDFSDRTKILLLEAQNEILSKSTVWIDLLHANGYEIRKIEPVKPVNKNRKCKGCDRDISHKHPNAKFHSKRCKDRYWNAANPRGYGLQGEHYHDLEDDFHPFDPTALGQE